MTKCFGFHSNSQGAEEIKDLQRGIVAGFGTVMQTHGRIMRIQR